MKSQAAFDAARKDLGEVVSQAQKELSKYAPASEQTVAPNSPSQEDFDHNAGTPGDIPEEHQSSSSFTESVSSPVQSLFSRIQSSLPPNISTTLQENLPSSLKDASGNVHIDFAQLKSTLSTEFQRVQDVTRAQAEEYVHKSEAIFKEAGDFLKEAVKVVPPNPNDDYSQNVVWDGMGSDIWIMPSPIGTPGWGASSTYSAKGKGKARNSLSGGAASHLAAGSRVEALLQRLKRDPEMIKLDPAKDEAVKAMYTKWVNDEVDVREGGMDNDIWRERIRTALEEKIAGEALAATRDVLGEYIITSMDLKTSVAEHFVVPSIMDEQTFWTRYFFRIYQIESEEERRKAILSGQLAILLYIAISYICVKGAAGTLEEDFSWEDEEDNDARTPGVAASTTTDIDAHLLRQSNETLIGNKTPASVLPEKKSDSLSVTPANASPRESSESSFDVVSSGHLSSFSDVIIPDKKTEKVEREEDADSDWE